MKVKVIDTFWWTGMGGTIGVALIDTGFEKKAYIKAVTGIDEKADTEEIVKWGNPLTLTFAQALIKHLKNENEKEISESQGGGPNEADAGSVL